jgi:outer membrane lipoprotein-sorting protein
MFRNSFKLKLSSNVLLLFVIFSVLFFAGCAVKAAKTGENSSGKTDSKQAQATSYTTESKLSASKAATRIEPNSPADTVRVFYKNLRERRFREALFLTNLRPAVESLTDDELKDLQVDFEPLAAQIPTDIQINGEIISKGKAAVTAKLPDNETGEMKLQEIKLREENGVWVILTVDEAAEAQVKKEGKNYFFALRIETHHNEARAMLNRIAKAQMIYSPQTNGLYGEMTTLIEKNLLPDDAQTAQTTGYNYRIELSEDKKKYTAIAAPSAYGKTGKLTFWFEVGGGKKLVIKSKDTKGQMWKM